MKRPRWAAAAALALLWGCASTSAPVAFTQEPDCFPGALPTTYALTMVDMPGFFAPIMADGVNAAFTARGMRPATPDEADVRVEMAFDLIDLNPPPAPRDPMAEALVPDDRNDFLARVRVTVTDPSGRLRWAGTLSRVHSLDGDETIHKPHAVALIHAAIEKLFTGFPAACGR